MANQEESHSVVARILTAWLCCCSCCKKPETLELNAVRPGSAYSSNLNQVQKPTSPPPLLPQSSNYPSASLPQSAPPPISSLSSSSSSTSSSSSQTDVQQSFNRLDSIEELVNSIPDFLAMELNDAVKNERFHFPDSTQPLNYNLKLIPNLKKEKAIYWGKVEINLVPIINTNQITLHSSGHKIRLVRLKSIGMDENIPVKYELKPTEKWLVIDLISVESVLIKDTVYKLTIVFDGYLSTAPFGFFIQTLVYETTDETNYARIAATLFEPDFAKLAFPSYDTINYRAPFTLSIARYESEIAVSNLRVIELGKKDEKLRLDGRVWDTFASVEPIPLYSVSFAILNDKFKYVGVDRPMGGDKVVAWAMSELRDQVDYAITIAKFAVQFMETITDVKYISDHTLLQLKSHIYMLQMQNTGMVDTIEEYQWSPILYTENHMLCYSDSCPELYKRTVALTVARKISYQWFGRFISSWSFPWLKNGFGKFFEFELVHLIEPSWRMAELHASVQMQSVMFEDGRSVLYPITVLEPVSSSCIKQMYSKNHFEILNGKAALYLRMLQNIVGQSTFTAAIQKFVKFGYRNDGTVTANDLWMAFQTQIIEDNIVNDLNLPENETIISIMNTWISRTGYPLLTARLNRKEDGTFILITQNQYGDNNDDQEPRNEPIVPITITTQKESNFMSTTPVAWLKGEQTELRIDILQNQWYILNLQNSAYVRITYTDGNWERLIRQLCLYNSTKISTLNRSQLIADSHILAIDGKLPLNIPIVLISYLEWEEDATVWLTALRHFKLLYFALSRDTRLAYKQYFLKLLKIEYRRTGFDSNSNEDSIKKIWRSEMLALLCMFQDEDCLENAEQRYQQTSDILSIDPNLQFSVLCTMVRKHEIEYVTQSNEMPTYALLAQALRKKNIVQKLKDLIVQHEAPCQKEIFSEALKCQQFWWSSPDYDMFKTLLQNAKIMIPGKFDEKMKAIVSQWESIYHILVFIEKMMSDWRYNPPNRSDVKALIKILKYLLHRVQGNLELNTLDRIITLANSFPGKMYTQLHDVLLYVQNTAIRGGKRMLDENELVFPDNTKECGKFVNDKLKHTKAYNP